MTRAAFHCCILNQGFGAWAFEPLAWQLARALRVPISTEPRDFNYLLNFEGTVFPRALFIPLAAIQLAADKRRIAQAFQAADVPTPDTVLLNSFADVRRFVATHPDREWCLKYPTACGAHGHRFVTADSTEPSNWPTPWLVQEFIRLDRPEVYRLYSAGGELFGWVARRFPAGHASSPWVAHAQGARYEVLDDAPANAIAAGRAALQASGLDQSFGCTDLLQRPSGEWVVLEVGTDGLFNHVDRDLGHPVFEAEISRRIARAFWHRAEQAALRSDHAITR